MALEHIKTWRIGEVEVTRIVEVWNREDPLSMLLEDGTPAMMLAYPWLHPHHATPAGDLLVNFQGFAIKAGRSNASSSTPALVPTASENTIFSPTCNPGSWRICRPLALDRLTSTRCSAPTFTSITSAGIPS